MVKPRENRVPIMMSDDELAATDDWRFANRVATRSSAIRKLCQGGLALEAAAPAIVEALERLTPDGHEPSAEVLALYSVLGPIIIGRLGIHSMSDMQIEVDQRPVLRALWDAANGAGGET